MGYPMTLRRVLDRNRLRDGDYGKPPAEWYRSFATIYDGSFGDPMEWYRKLAEDYKATLGNYNERMALLAGDLRRLERDSVDENAICKYICRRTGADADTVAAVLKAYLEF